MINCSRKVSQKDDRQYRAAGPANSTPRESAVQPVKGWPELNVAIVSPLPSEENWSQEKDDILRELVDASAPIGVICSRLKCTDEAVRTRVLVLRLRIRALR